MTNLHLNISLQTEERLKYILNLYNDSDAFFNDVINYQIQQIKKEQFNLQLDLFEFEKLYGISSSEFYNQYKLGKQGDSQNILLWAGIYEMFMENNEKLLHLK